MSNNLQIFLTLTFVSLIPFFILAFTPFAKYIIFLLFLRRSVSTPTIPSNQILMVLALFLTFINITPLLNQLNQQVLKPYLNKKITQKEMILTGKAIILKHLKKDSDLVLYKTLKKMYHYKKLKGEYFFPIATSYLFNQIKKGLIAGFLIYLPFMMFDLIIAAILISLGIMMLPPMYISLPFKIAVFLLAGGWNFFITYLLLI